MKLKTNPYRTEPGAYIREIMLRWLGRRVWLFALVVVVCAVLAALVDTAFLFVAVIALLLIFPFAVTTVYFNYALSPASTRWRRLRRLTITADEVVVEYLDEPELPGKTPAPETFKLSGVTSFRPGKRYDTLVFSRRLDDILIVTTDAFPESEGDAETSPRATFHALIFNQLFRNK